MIYNMVCSIDQFRRKQQRRVRNTRTQSMFHRIQTSPIYCGSTVFPSRVYATYIIHHTFLLIIMCINVHYNRESCLDPYQHMSFCTTSTLRIRTMYNIPKYCISNCSVNVFNYQYSNMGVQQLHILYSHSASMVSHIQYHGGTTLWSCSIVTWMYPFRTTGLKFCAPKKRLSAVTAVSCLLLCKRRQNDQRSSFIAFFIKVIVF